MCFGSSCEISVYGMCESDCEENSYDYGKIIKDGEVLYYYDNLMYGAIFSSNDIYKCNVKRLMNRISILSNIYIEKIDIIAERIKKI